MIARGRRFNSESENPRESEWEAGSVVKERRSIGYSISGWNYRFCSSSPRSWYIQLYTTSRTIALEWSNIQQTTTQLDPQAISNW